MPLSIDLRERIAAAIVTAEESHPLIGERFEVSVSTVERISTKVREGKDLAPRKHPGPAPVLAEKHLVQVRVEIERDPYISSYELTNRFNRRFPKNQVHRSTILRAMHQLKYSFKKNSVRSATRPP